MISGILKVQTACMGLCTKISLITNNGDEISIDKEVQIVLFKMMALSVIEVGAYVSIDDEKIKIL